MKAIFWIGCIFVVLLGLTGFGAATETMENNTTTALAVVGSAAENVTADENQSAVSPVQETAVGGNVSVPVESNVSVPAEPVSEAAAEVPVESNVSVPAEPVSEAAAEVPVESNVSVPAEPVSEATAEVPVESNVSVPAEPVSEAPVSVAEPAENVSAADSAREELVSFVKDLQLIAQKSGKNAAISAFNDRAGQYADPKMSVFAYDYSGNLLADPMNLASIGTSQVSASDSQGMKYVQMMMNTAKTGEGFVEYTAPNLMEQNKVMKKLVYVVDVDGSWFVGSGVFMDDSDENAGIIKTAKISPSPDANTPPAQA
ncbi:MAG: cache domain-containing protein [Methanospirillum sp.]|nr:cache domain-containing protein [Methanospirillum sp.]